MGANRPSYHKWYKTAKWQKRRAGQLREAPLCAFCLEEGVSTPATVADHVVEHKGNPVLFWDGELQSLCAPHHNSDKQIMERGGERRATIGADGYPIELKQL